MFETLDKIKRDSIMTTIIFIFAGNLLLIIPEPYIPFLSNAVGFVLLVVSVATVFNYMGSAKALIHYIKLAGGLFAGLFGIMLFTFDELFILVLTALVGVIPFLLGLYGIYHAVAFARRSKRRGWWILIILSSLLIIFGGFAFLNPWKESAQAVLQVTGGSLMYSAFVSLLSLIWIWPVHRD